MSWVDAAELAHLPSLRNQIGQGHVNADLSSLAWVAAPPYTFGYHTGVLRRDGAILPAQRFRWKPWGVQREHADPGLTVRTDTRMMLQRDTLLWQVEVTNTTGDPVDCTISQDLFAMVAQTETGWGWLYDVPWTGGNYHDFMTLERIRSSVVREPGSAYLLGPGPRRLRLGKPRLPGIQRDVDTEPMSLAYELPRHVSPDTVYPHQRSAVATVRNIRCRAAGADRPILVASAEIALQPASEVTLGTFELHAGQLIDLDLRLDAPDQTGVVFTHGNHPDSLQLGVDACRTLVRHLRREGVRHRRRCRRTLAPGHDRTRRRAGRLVRRRRSGRRHQPLVRLAAVEVAAGRRAGEHRRRLLRCPRQLRIRHRPRFADDDRRARPR